MENAEPRRLLLRFLIKPLSVANFSSSFLIVSSYCSKVIERAIGRNFGFKLLLDYGVGSSLFASVLPWFLKDLWALASFGVSLFPSMLIILVVRVFYRLISLTSSVLCRFKSNFFFLVPFFFFDRMNSVRALLYGLSDKSSLSLELFLGWCSSSSLL